jgi:hypothetical protein
MEEAYEVASRNSSDLELGPVEAAAAVSVEFLVIVVRAVHQ